MGGGAAGASQTSNRPEGVLAQEYDLLPGRRQHLLQLHRWLKAQATFQRGSLVANEREINRQPTPGRNTSAGVFHQIIERQLIQGRVNADERLIDEQSVVAQGVVLNELHNGGNAGEIEDRNESEGGYPTDPRGQGLLGGAFHGINFSFQIFSNHSQGETL